MAVLQANGHCLLVLPERQLDETAAVDEKLGYPAKLHSTLVDDQREASSETLKSKLTGRIPKRVGVEFASFSPHLTFLTSLGGTDFGDVGPSVCKLRLRKDADEIAMLRRANEANQAMYARAREIVRPGVNEIDVYNELYTVAVKTLGEPLTYFGQDFRSAARGGTPRNRVIEAGELYIFDLGVGFRGYYSDNCRTIAVGGEPTDKQMQAWQRRAGDLADGRGEREAGRELQDAVRSGPEGTRQKIAVDLQSSPGSRRGPDAAGRAAFESELGRPFRGGQFLAVEPGLYHDDLRYGVRLEQNYLVTATGVELLTPWPLELV